MQIDLETNRLLLRKLNKDDYKEIYYGWASDNEVTKFLTWNPHKDINETKKILDIWLKEYDNKNTYRFGIVLKDNNKLIGTIDVVNYINGNPEVGYVLNRNYWDKGIMSEALEKVSFYLLVEGYNCVYIKADENNIASNKVIIKNGFKFIEKQTQTLSNIKPYLVTYNCYILKR